MKTRLKLILILISYLFVSCSEDISHQMIGEWKVSDMRVTMKNVPEQLLKNAKTLSLATSYQFKNDGQYCMTISKNSLEHGRKHKGEMILDPKNYQIHLKTDSLLVEKDGNWALIEKNDLNRPMFQSMSLKIEQITSNQMILSEKESNGVIYYTLDRINE